MVDSPYVYAGVVAAVCLLLVCGIAIYKMKMSAQLPVHMYQEEDMYTQNMLGTAIDQLYDSPLFNRKQTVQQASALAKSLLPDWEVVQYPEENGWDPDQIPVRKTMYVTFDPKNKFEEYVAAANKQLKFP